jgi:hypothetical protein
MGVLAAHSEHVDLGDVDGSPFLAVFFLKCFRFLPSSEPYEMKTY